MTGVQTCALPILALEVQAVGIDISFAPVLDVLGICDIIGDRAFHPEPEYISQLAAAFIEGMQLVGMQATGKHFPGHGNVKEDSHIELPIDQRSKKEIFSLDLLPFRQLIKQNVLSAVMPAHIVYPDVDSQAVGFSPFWLQQVLRQELGFDGVVFSDDLSMEGAAVVGGYIERAEAAQQAGCDMLLVCNNRQASIEILDNANLTIEAKSAHRLQRLLKQSDTTWSTLSTNALWQQAHKFVEQYN